MIAVIAAYAKNKIIGSKGKIPWDIPSETKVQRDYYGFCNHYGQKDV